MPLTLLRYAWTAMLDRGAHARWMQRLKRTLIWFEFFLINNLRIGDRLVRIKAVALIKETVLLLARQIMLMILEGMDPAYERMITIGMDSLWMHVCWGSAAILERPRSFIWEHSLQVVDIVNMF